MNVVTLWIADLDHRPLDGGCLSDDEMARAARLRPELARSRFIASRSALRRVLSRALDMPPDAVRFALNENGKPRLDERLHSGNLRFNLSHSASFAAIAIAYGIELGVDLEEMRPERMTSGIVETFFTTGEADDFRAAPDPVEAFYRIWTSKEARVKAAGAGLAAEPPPDRTWFEWHGQPVTGYYASVAADAEFVCELRFL